MTVSNASPLGTLTTLECLPTRVWAKAAQTLVGKNSRVLSPITTITTTTTTIRLVHCPKRAAQSVVVHIRQITYPRRAPSCELPPHQHSPCPMSHARVRVQNYVLNACLITGSHPWSVGTTPHANKLRKLVTSPRRLRIDPCLYIIIPM